MSKALRAVLAGGLLAVTAALAGCEVNVDDNDGAIDPVPAPSDRKLDVDVDVDR